MTAHAPRILIAGSMPAMQRRAAASILSFTTDRFLNKVIVPHVGTRFATSVFARLRTAFCDALQTLACLWSCPALVHARPGYARKPLLLSLASRLDLDTIFRLPAAGAQRRNRLPLVRHSPARVGATRVVVTGNTRHSKQARGTVAQHYFTEAIRGRMARIYNDLAGIR